MFTQKQLISPGNIGEGIGSGMVSRISLSGEIIYTCNFKQRKPSRLLLKFKVKACFLYN